MTFRGFTSPARLFELLVERYQMDHPASLSTEEFEEWKEKKLRPTQKRVLTILTMWLEDHKLLDEEPHMAQQLTEFLSLIVAPEPLATTAKLIAECLKRLVNIFRLSLLHFSDAYILYRHSLSRNRHGLPLALGGTKILRSTKTIFSNITQMKLENSSVCMNRHCT